MGAQAPFLVTIKVIRNTHTTVEMHARVKRAFTFRSDGRRHGTFEQQCCTEHTTNTHNMSRVCMHMNRLFAQHTCQRVCVLFIHYLIHAEMACDRRSECGTGAARGLIAFTNNACILHALMTVNNGPNPSTNRAVGERDCAHVCHHRAFACK